MRLRSSEGEEATKRKLLYFWVRRPNRLPSICFARTKEDNSSDHQGTGDFLGWGRDSGMLLSATLFRKEVSLSQC